MQRNACAALTAIMNASTILYHTVAEAPDLVVRVAKCFILFLLSCTGTVVLI